MPDLKDCFTSAVAERADQSEDFIAELFWHLVGALLRLIAGALVGAPAGHLSHLAMDLGTPKGLPVI